jgi:hypothetical protein
MRKMQRAFRRIQFLEVCSMVRLDFTLRAFAGTVVVRFLRLGSVRR